MLADGLPPLNALRAFRAAARHRSFRGAAEALNVTQSAVAQQVRGLEQALGARLFERQARGLALTAAGEALLQPVDQAFRLIADAAARIAHQAEVLTLSTTPSFISRWLVPRLDGFTRGHPGIDVRLSASNDLVDFQRDGVDLAVRYGTGIAPGLASQLLFPADPVAVCSPALCDAAIGLDDLGGRVKLLHDSHFLWAEWYRAVGRDEAEARRGVRFSHTLHAIEAALLGQGIALVPRPLVERELRAGQLVAPLDIRLPEAGARGFYIVAPPETWDSRKVAAMRLWLLAEAAGGAA
ncbi:DNA-binding transcriptional LysR family regulator [Inquilinus ginsengisoli]|uniref:DNA-binding transcriptional LysR family regulator n=1 Tax=Inquilinus ginsengisoli TaxID=363840 RepID=A0ABU1JIQ9_9PROT|nr:transcriptional regulator GcvA [Inquilinus ginsengisoli]MDR6288501.1 DNA-binding transcriptional LysR family regulator [Inquilinus ginsengisoli]